MYQLEYFYQSLTWISFHSLLPLNSHQVCSSLPAASSLLPHLGHPDRWHARRAQMPSVADCPVVVILVTDFIVLPAIIARIIVLVLSREPSLDALVHGCTLQPLLLLVLALGPIVAQLLVDCCLLVVHLARGAVGLRWHHVTIRCRGTV